MTLKLQVPEFKFCIFYEKKQNHSNTSNVIKYPCYNNEICCDRDNGCCPASSVKYYESWCFWIFVLGMALGCYLLCWYCKKLEKKRQRRRNERNGPSVDRLLETLILNYRNRLVNQNQQAVRNVDEVKPSEETEAPPEYVDAINMPKPDLNRDVQHVSSNESMQNRADKENEHSVVIDFYDQTVPSYEDAIKKM